ncbi:MAG: type II toxin-antitoxin system Phd/YefM family antitoxin [Burkholderiales bacterium]
MNAVAFSQFRKRISELLESLEPGEPLTVTRADGRDFVIVSAEEWSSLQTTMHELSSPANVKRLREAHEEIEADIARRKHKAA